MMLDYWEESKIAKGWLQMQDMSGNRLQLMLFHEVKNKALNIDSCIEDPIKLKKLMINDFCKLMMNKEVPSEDFLTSKKRLIQAYWCQAEKMSGTMKKATELSCKYQAMVEKLTKQVRKNADKDKNEVPRVLLKYPPICILQSRQLHCK